MNPYLFIITTLLLLTSCSEEKEEWVDFDYDQAYAYYFDNELAESSSHDGVLVDGKLNPSVMNPDGAKLSTGQIVEVSRVMGGQYSDGPVERTDCYIPHHGILFYSAGKIVADITVCFQCNQIKSHPDCKNVDAEDLRMIFIHHDIPLEYDEFPERAGPVLHLDSLGIKR